MRVINLSFGCTTHDNRPPTVLERAVQRLAPSIVLVAAAGNHGRPSQNRRGGDHRGHPGLAGRLRRRDRRGRPGGRVQPEGPWVNVLADGARGDQHLPLGEVETYERNLNGVVEVEDKQQFAGYATWSGTSFACAAVVGEIAARAAARDVSPRVAAELIVADAADEVLAELSL